MPSWVQDGGLEKWIERLKDPAIRAKVKQIETEVAIGQITPALAADQIADLLRSTED